MGEIDKGFAPISVQLLKLDKQLTRLKDRCYKSLNIGILSRLLLHKFSNMQKFFILLLAPAFFIACNNSGSNKVGADSAAINPGRHSAAFNQSIQSAMDSYYNLTEAFVNWDSVKASSLAATLNARLDSLPLSELKNNTSAAKADSLIGNAKKDVAGLIAASDITTKRHALNALSDHLFDFLNTVQYDRQKLYLQECPMAFNDTEPGHWLSSQDSIRNPYLGLHHPYYKSAMIECGSNKAVVNFTEAK
jgi:hypothetical protein